jgi:hypothetical protein
MPAARCRLLSWMCAITAFVVACILSGAAAYAFPVQDNYGTMNSFGGADSNTAVNSSFQNENRQKAKPDMAQNNNGISGYADAQQGKKVMPTQQESQMAGMQKANQQMGGGYSGQEGSGPDTQHYTIQPEVMKTMTALNSTQDALDRQLLGGAPSAATALLQFNNNIAAVPNALGGGGGSLLDLLDETLIPQGSCCKNAQGIFDPLNPPLCCKVNGIFDPLAAKPECCTLKNNNNNNNNGGGGGGGGQPPSTLSQSVGFIGGMNDGGSAAGTAAMAAGVASSLGAAPNANGQQSCSNGQCKQGSRASSAGEDGIFILSYMVEDYKQYLVNVANAGGGGSAKQPVKTYQDVAGMVLKMYKHTYIPLAILFLLPGAILTQTKGLVSFGIINTKDEDTVSPFVGILRAIIAIFLIPATQLVVSYAIDVGNACESVIAPEASMPLILLWVEEQVVTFSPDQQGKLIKNIPNIPLSPLRGKFVGMPKAGAIMEQVSGLDTALAEICNEAVHMLGMAMSIMSAFQLVTICYLMLVGPLAAAFFAWPGVGRELFRRAFASWLDGVVLVTLWKFWWCVVLACWTLWIKGTNPFDPMGPYWCIAWMAILTTVPFNPFEFKPGEIIGSVLSKAEAVAAKVAQSGKGGGSGGGGKAKGGG